MTGPWRNYFAWLPTKIDGRTYWLRLIQRRRVVISIGLAMGVYVAQVCWQYRLPPQ